MSPEEVSVREEGEGHSMYMDLKQKRHGNQQWRVWCKESGGWEYQKWSGKSGRVCKVEDSHRDNTEFSRTVMYIFHSFHGKSKNLCGLGHKQPTQWFLSCLGFWEDAAHMQLESKTIFNSNAASGKPGPALQAFSKWLNATVSPNWTELHTDTVLRKFIAHILTNTTLQQLTPETMLCVHPWKKTVFNLEMKNGYNLICFKGIQVSNLVFYAQSTITVISGRYTFCQYTITVKNMSMLKIYTYSIFFLNSCKKWVKHKLETFSQIYICFLKSI